MPKQEYSSLDAAPVVLYGKKDDNSAEANPVFIDENGNLRIALPTDGATESKQEDIISTLKQSQDETTIIGSGGSPLQQHEKESPNYPVQELLTFDTNLHTILGSQDLTSKGRLKVENSFVPEQIVYGVLNRVNEEVKINLTGQGTVALQLTGTWAGTMTFYGSIDGQNWHGIYGHIPDAVTGFVLNTTVNDIFRFHVVGLLAFKVQFTTYTSGAARAMLISTPLGMSYTQSFVGGSQAQLLQQRPTTLEQSTHDSALREAFYITETWNPNLIYFPGDIVKWNGRIYRCIAQTAAGVSSSYAPGTGYWAIEIRPERSLSTNLLVSSPDAPRLRIELDLDAYQYRLAESQMLDQQLQIQNDMVSNDYALSISQDYGGGYGKRFGVGQDSMTHYEFNEAR